MRKLLLLTFTCLSLNAQAADKPPILIGDIGAYTNGALFALPYKNGVELAVEEINKAGGVLGRPLKIISRDSKMDPAEAVRLAQELRTRDKVDLLMNCDASNNTLGVSSWAKQNNLLMMVNCSESDSVVWEKGTDLVFRSNPGGYMWTSASFSKAMEVYGDQLKNKRWVTVAPNFEFGQSLVAAAKKISADEGLNAQWVGQQWPSYNKMDAGATIQAIERAKPDIIFCALFDSDLVKFVREGKKRGLFKNRLVIAPPAGIPEHLELVGKEMPAGWAVIGTPYEDIEIASFETFLGSYGKITKDPFRGYALNGYNGTYALAKAIETAGSTDAAKVAKALAGITFDTPVGEMQIRKLDHQATVPVWGGMTKVENDKARLDNITMYPASETLPDDKWVQDQRKTK